MKPAHTFRKYADRLLGGESVRRPVPLSGSVPLALIYPNSYAVGMSSLGYQTVFRLFNEQPLFQCERAFVYEEPFEYVPLTLETAKTLRSFPLIAFSVAYELDLFHAVRLLDSAGIPVLADERGPDHPFVLFGGVITFYNPVLFAPMADAVLIGEAEILVPELARACEPLSPDRDFRPRLAAELSGKPGFYLPGHHRENGAVERQWVDLDLTPPSTSFCVPESSHMKMFMVEVGRGCGRGCRFCAAGHVYAPFRLWPRRTIIDQVLKFAAPGDRIGLVGASLSDFRSLDALCLELQRRGYQIGLSSLRADRLSDELLDVLSKSSVRSVSLAPEAGSQRLRRVIRKTLSDDDILSAAERIGRAGIEQLKLYFMIGLPFEQQQDVEAIRTLTESICRRCTGIREIRISINAFVPKPRTPFQWAPMADEKYLKRTRRYLVRSLSSLTRVRVLAKSARREVVQALLSNADEAMAHRLATDSEIRTSEAVQKLRREKHETEVLPWERVEKGEETPRLWRSWQEAKKMARYSSNQ